MRIMTYINPADCYNPTLAARLVSCTLDDSMDALLASDHLPLVADFDL